MHELAITQSIVEAICEKIGSARATRVRIEVGQLSGVFPDSIRFCFDLCAKATVLEGALLEINEIAGCARCMECGGEFVLDTPVPLCACGSANLEFISGHELRIKEVELEDV